MTKFRTFFWAVLVVFYTIIVLVLTNRSVTPRKATWDDVTAAAQKGGYKLIKTDELKKLYHKDPKALLLVDTRQEWEYGAGHIKGALNFPMEPTSFSRWKKRGGLKTFLGQDLEKTIVFY